MQAMIFAAGLGTRLRPLTLNKPKALVRINDKTLLEYNVQKMVSYGIENIVVNVHHFAQQIIQEVYHLNQKYHCNIVISCEDNQLLDTGGGLLKAKELFLLGEPILVHNVDILSDIDFYDMQKVFFNTKTLSLLAVQQRQTSRYLLFNNTDELCGWENVQTKEKIITKQSLSYQAFAFSGIQIVSYDIFDKITQRGVFSIIDTYLQLSKTNIIRPYLHQGKWVDVGKLSAIEKAESLFGKNENIDNS